MTWLVRRALVVVGGMALAAFASGVACSGSETTEDAPAATGGTGGEDSSTGGSGGMDARTEASPDVHSTGGTAGSAGGGADVEAPDVSPDTGCTAVGLACDVNADTCCEGYACQDFNGQYLCLPLSDSGTDAQCVAEWGLCTGGKTCCPGLNCEAVGPTEICRAPADAAQCVGYNQECSNATAECCFGLECQTTTSGDRCRPGLIDGSLCTDVYDSCNGASCCIGTTCTTDPPSFPQPTCLPLIEPNPDHCPATSPSGLCFEIGLRCDYPPMTTCTCRYSGWECAY